MWWAVWWSGLALALGGAGAAAQQSDQLPSRLDEGTLNYIFAPAEERRYMPGQDIWSHILDPRRMALPLVARDREEEWPGNEEREKRRLPSLSINNPMDVLRQRLLLEIARKHMREHVVRQAEENRNMLQEIGK